MSNSLGNRPPVRSLIAVLSTASLVAVSLVAGTSASAAPAFGFGGGGSQTTFEPGRYIVTLADDAVATYDGGLPGYPGTQPNDDDQLNARRAPVQNYSDYLSAKQSDVAEAAGVTIDVSYTTALNAFSAVLTPTQAADLLASRDVLAVTPDELKHITATPSTTFLGLDGPGGVWESIGGADQAGDGVVVGILDTGIAPENPSFAGEQLQEEAGPDPYLDGDVITFAKSDGSTFLGACQGGEQFEASDCSTKIVGARYFVEGFGEGNLGDASTGPGEFVSPRDGDGHGSHTAGTAAGNFAVPSEVGGIDFGAISGVAPGAKIASYKVCWSGPDASVQTDDGCTTTDILAAINQAVIDGVDVLNYSIGGGAAQTTYSPTDDAFLGAAAAGIFVAASAGNDGPAASTLDNASPWITTVAASTIPSYEATVTLGDGEAFAGASITVDFDAAAEPVTGALVNAAAVAGSGTTDANLCAPGSLDPALIEAETIIVCERGVYDRVAKSAEVQRAGGIGMVLVNVLPGSIDTDFHSVPTVHLDAQYRDQVVAYAATDSATATFTTGNQTDYSPPAPQVAGFSSRGPLVADGSNLLKPDISAPGVSILAAGANAENVDPVFQFLSGTSMSSPHIAGLAALYLGERPNASSSEIKSAMMTTAYNTLDAVGAAVVDPFVQGAGHVDPTRFFEPGLLYLNGTLDWLGYLQGLGYNAGVEPIDGSDLNLASISVGTLTAPRTITRSVTSTEAGTFTPTVEGLAGIDVAVAPASLPFAGAGETLSYTVTFTRTDAALDEFATGALTWSSGSSVVRSPVAVRPVTLVAPDSIEGEGPDGGVDIEVIPGGNGDIPLGSSGLTAGSLLPDPSGGEEDSSGAGVTGDGAEYLVDVPAGAEFVRFDLDTADDTADLDLIVYELDADGNPVAGYQSATGAADERVDIISPNPATYSVLVDVFAASMRTTWDTTVTSVVDGGEPLSLSPSVLAGAQGVAVSYRAQWSDLQLETTYLGLISYGATGEFTVLQVKTGEESEPTAPTNITLPTIAGTPDVGGTLTATPGGWGPEEAEFDFEYQWQADGLDIPGATGGTYVIVPADEGKSITVVVRASFAGEGASTSATSVAVTVRFASTTTLSLSRRIFVSWRPPTASIDVDIARGEPTGAAIVTVNGRTVSGELILAADGSASFRLPRLPVGLHSVQVVYLGDDLNAGSKSVAKLVLIVR